MTLVQRPLTPDELSGILTRINEAPGHRDALVAAVIGTFDTLMHDIGRSWATETSIDPTDYSIPKDQWLTICAALTEFQVGEQGSANVNLGLDWMNRGPSAFEPTSC